PKNWAFTTLGQICRDINYGYTASASEKPCGPKFLRITDIQKSSSRLNHRLPGRQTHAKVMQRAADFHDQITDARLPQAAGVVDDTAALHAAVDMLNADAAACNSAIGGLLRPREGSAPWLLGRHD